MKVLPSIGVALLLFSQIVCARSVPAWSHSKLFERSDVVVIASPIGSSDTADVTIENAWNVEFVGIVTSLKVHHVLKGIISSSDPIFFHYRILNNLVSLENGPSLVSFRTGELRYTIENGPKVFEAVPPVYLIYMIEREDGRYEAVTGQIDPLFSVFELMSPN